MIYFDHAASSYPKPKSVAVRMAEAINEYSANPGRGGHKLASKAKSVIEQTRKKLAHMFQAPSGKHVFFYQNATMAINQALIGFPFQKNDHVVTTMFEHNSIIRPLEKLKKEKGINVTYVEPDENGIISIEKIKEACRNETKMVAVTHASNVTGAVFPLEHIKSIKKDRNVVVFVDASQTAGTLPIQMEDDGVDLLAFPGHKSLLGPQGIGVLISRDDFQLEPLIYGGTGSHSELLEQPNGWPDRYEAGTLNTPGIAGLLAGLEEIEKLGLANIRKHEERLMNICLEEMKAIDGITVFGPTDLRHRVGVISFKINGVSSHEVAMILDEHYNIAVRAGLHCAPLVHEQLKTNEDGLIRVSFGPYNTEEEVRILIEALQEIATAFQ